VCGEIKVPHFFRTKSYLMAYRAPGNGQYILGHRTSTSGTLAAATSETTTPSTGRKRTGRDWTRRRVGPSRAVAMLTGPDRTLSRRANLCAKSAHNHFHQVQGAQMRMQCFWEDKPRQLPRTGSTGSPEW